MSNCTSIEKLAASDALVRRLITRGVLIPVTGPLPSDVHRLAAISLAAASAGTFTPGWASPTSRRQMVRRCFYAVKAHLNQAARADRSGAYGAFVNEIEPAWKWTWRHGGYQIRTRV